MDRPALRLVLVVHLFCFYNCGWGELLPFSHGRQSRGEGYTGPAVHFALEAIDGDPTTYSCTQSTSNSWIQLYFATPTLPHWIKFSLKPTSTLSLLDHRVDLYNGERWVRSCDLEYEERWVCTGPVSLATSVRVSIQQGKMEIADIEAHGDRLPVDELKYKPVCDPRNLDSCKISPVEWDLECKPIDILLPFSGYQQHSLTFMSDDRQGLGTLSWSKFSSPALISDQCDVIYGETPDFNDNQSGGRWCVDKNFTHLELTDGMQAQLLTDLRDNRFCKSPLLGDSVGFVNFTENLQDAQYRAGVADMSGEARFSNNDWMDVGQGDVRPLKLEKVGIAVYVAEEFSGAFSVPFYTETGLGMNKKMEYLGSLKLTTNTFTMEGCTDEHVFPEENISGTWMFEKNETYMLICKDNREVEGIQFDEHGFECARRYSGNVVDGIGSDLPDMKYRELVKSGPDEMRFVRSCPDCVPDYFVLEKHGIHWEAAPEVTLTSLTLTMMNLNRSVIGSVEITPSQILVKTDGCTWSEEGEYNLKGRWRLVKLVDMLCIFLEDVMVFEEHLEGPRCMAGDVVRYLIFDQEDILYRRTNKDIEKIYSEVYGQGETANCPEGYGPLVFNTADGYKEVECQPCRRGTYSKGKECLYCPKGMFTLKTASTGPEHCMPKEMIECDGTEDITNCWLKSEKSNRENETSDFCNCRSDQYCNNGACFDYMMSDSRRTAALPGTILGVTILHLTFSKLLCR